MESLSWCTVRLRNPSFRVCREANALCIYTLLWYTRFILFLLTKATFADSSKERLSWTVSHSHFLSFPPLFIGHCAFAPKVFFFFFTHPKPIKSASLYAFIMLRLIDEGSSIEWTYFVTPGLRKPVSINKHCSGSLFMRQNRGKRAMENSTFELSQHTPHTAHCKVLSWNMNKTLHVGHGFRKSRKHLLVESKWLQLNNAIIPPPPSEVRCGRRGWIDVFAHGYLVPMQCSLEWEWIRAVARQTCSQAPGVWWTCLAG